MRYFNVERDILALNSPESFRLSRKILSALWRATIFTFVISFIVISSSRGKMLKLSETQVLGLDLVTFGVIALFLASSLLACLCIPFYEQKETRAQEAFYARVLTQRETALKHAERSNEIFSIFEAFSSTGGLVTAEDTRKLEDYETLLAANIKALNAVLKSFETDLENSSARSRVEDKLDLIAKSWHMLSFKEHAIYFSMPVPSGMLAK